MAKLIIMVGLPFSGKSTRAKQLAKEYNAIVLNKDEWHIRIFAPEHGIETREEHDTRRVALEAIIIPLAFDLLSRGQNIILDIGFWAKEERLNLKKKAEEIGAEFLMCYCEAPPPKELAKRMAERNREQNSTSFFISEEMYKEFAPKFQAPTEDELKYDINKR